MTNLPLVSGEYKLRYTLSHLTWFKVGGAAEIFFKPHDREDLSSFLSQNAGKLPIIIIGAGSNIIIRDGGVEGVVIKLGQNFTNIEKVDNKLYVGAGCLNFNLAKFCYSNSIKGFEFLIGIPGTIGGGVAMNAGAYGSEFKDIVHSIEALDSMGNAITLLTEEIGFKYRGNSLPDGLVVTKAIFNIIDGNQAEIKSLMDKIMVAKVSTQPTKDKTSGSTFANPESYQAWRLIDEVGLRGYRVGGAAMSELHCNFMINDGSATAKDLEDLGEFVRQKVFERTSVMLNWEIKRIGKYV
jgi:UDP-N-acetylmuramate dehydrogenase